MHASGQFLIAGSEDGSWSLNDIENQQLIVQEHLGEPITAIEFHPDGLIFCIGLASGQIRLYDIRTQKMAQELQSVHGSPVKKIGFSNKGIHMAVLWQSQPTCRIFSLHKNCDFVDLKHS